MCTGNGLCFYRYINLFADYQSFVLSPRREDTSSSLTTSWHDKPIVGGFFVFFACRLIYTF